VHSGLNNLIYDMISLVFGVKRNYPICAVQASDVFMLLQVFCHVFKYLYFTILYHWTVCHGFF